ncbi:protein fd. isoform [Echinococcus multilocularis]|uniref:Protein fd. isoform n=1 Tax=Echinococcus multilocularis TaxID=6211 RepID=A0A0S4MNB7_ECHMU|nr:protein fd. isoform [Echinococcus multilocularis]
MASAETECHKTNKLLMQLDAWSFLFPSHQHDHFRDREAGLHSHQRGGTKLRPRHGFFHIHSTPSKTAPTPLHSE